ncbi:hypothetical protein GCM10009789_46600 [Kribbella sancticallisti]|uniref:Uncharacterized protein n=1 Tax=Kribbella sancticallisti TaxID=460087 RepID=A0ABN2DV70_9ACTN
MTLRTAPVQIDGQMPAEGSPRWLPGQPIGRHYAVHKPQPAKPTGHGLSAGQQQRAIAVLAAEATQRRYCGQGIAETERAQDQNRAGHYGQDGSTDGQTTSSRTSTPGGWPSA